MHIASLYSRARRNLRRNHKIVSLVAFGVLTVSVLAAGAGLSLHESRSAQTVATEQPASTSNQAQPATVSLDPEAAASTETTSPSSAAPNSTTQPAPTKTSQVTSPAALPHVTPAVTISADGCTVTGVADAGLIFVMGSYLPGHHGGQAGYTMPASQTFTGSAGGTNGSKSFGEIIDASGNVLVQVTADITAESCPPASAGALNPTDAYPMPPDA